MRWGTIDFESITKERTNFFFNQKNKKNLKFTKIRPIMKELYSIIFK